MANYKVTAVLEINSLLYCKELKFHRVAGTWKHIFFFIMSLKILSRFF